MLNKMRKYLFEYAEEGDIVKAKIEFTGDAEYLARAISTLLIHTGEEGEEMLNAIAAGVAKACLDNEDLHKRLKFVVNLDEKNII